MANKRGGWTIRMIQCGNKRGFAHLVLSAMGVSAQILACASVSVCQVTGKSGGTVTVATAGPVAGVRSLAGADTHNISEDMDEIVAWSATLPIIPGGQGSMSLAQALANGKAYSERQTTKQQLAALSNSPMAKDARSLQAMAAAAIAENKPSTALAALLLAREKNPKDRMILIDLAGLMAPMGMPREALALLDEADRGQGDLPSPMGIKGRAIALNNRGYALMLLGRWAEAQPPLQEAMSMAPLLSEAARNLALVLYKLGKEDDAKRILFFGVWRTRGQMEAPTGPKKPGAAQVPSVRPGPKTPEEEDEYRRHCGIPQEIHDSSVIHSHSGWFRLRPRHAGSRRGDGGHSGFSIPRQSAAYGLV